MSEPMSMQDNLLRLASELDGHRTPTPIEAEIARALRDASDEVSRVKRLETAMRLANAQNASLRVRLDAAPAYQPRRPLNPENRYRMDAIDANDESGLYE